MLELLNVRRTVGGEQYIIDASIQLASGSLNVLLGPTLSGKTSLMRLMAGLDAPTSGRILMQGRDVTGVPVRRRNVAMVYQQFINYPTLSVYENIASPLRVKGEAGAEIDRKVQRAAELMKLTPYLMRTPLSLSGGQQQRTALARALVKGADLVLLDEPLANLDYKLREELREELPKIFAETGAIFVYATTEPTEALLLGGMTATLSKGRVTQFGPTTTVYRRPHDLATARIFSDPPLNVLGALKRGADFRTASGLRIPARGDHAALADGNYSVGIRAHRLMLEQGGSAIVEIKARIVVTEVTGSQTFVHADHGSERLIALVQGVRRLAPGDPVSLFFDPADMLVFDEGGAAVGARPALAA